MSWWRVYRWHRLRTVRRQTPPTPRERQTHAFWNWKLLRFQCFEIQRIRLPRSGQAWLSWRFTCQACGSNSRFIHPEDSSLYLSGGDRQVTSWLRLQFLSSTWTFLNHFFWGFWDSIYFYLCIKEFKVTCNMHIPCKCVALVGGCYKALRFTESLAGDNNFWSDAKNTQTQKSVI